MGKKHSDRDLVGKSKLTETKRKHSKKKKKSSTGENRRTKWKAGDILLVETAGPCYQRGSPCQDPAGNWTTRRPPDDRKETQTAVVWSCLPFNRSGQNHLARHGEKGKRKRQTEEEV